MKELKSVQEIEAKLKELDRCVQDCCFMIDGGTIGVCMKTPSLTNFFFEVACKAPVVCVCRCSPTQKADITRMV
jgi:phospholipid-translocating ATPase